MSNNGKLVRTDLSEAEFAEFRKLAIDLGVKTGRAGGDAIRTYIKTQRAVLKGAKP